VQSPWSLDHALRERGGIAEVRRRSSGHPTHFGIRLEFLLPTGRSGHYAFRIGALTKGGFEVQRETYRIYGATALDTWFYEVESGRVIRNYLKTLNVIARSAATKQSQSHGW